jgi:hypothetical protein
MRLAELEEMMSEEPTSAEAVIEDLVSRSSVEELSHIAREGRVPALKLRAIEGLGQVGGPAATAALSAMLETVERTPFLEGGTEQRHEHEAVRAGLARSLTRARSAS